MSIEKEYPGFDLFIKGVMGIPMKEISYDGMDDVKGYAIKKHPKGRGICCLFEHEGEHYYASMRDIPCLGPECMIFEADASGEIVDFAELFCRRDMEISPKSLVGCIEAFKRGYCY